MFWPCLHAFLPTWVSGCTHWQPLLSSSTIGDEWGFSNCKQLQTTARRWTHNFTLHHVLITAWQCTRHELDHSQLERCNAGCRAPRGIWTMRNMSEMHFHSTVWSTLLTSLSDVQFKSVCNFFLQPQWSWLHWFSQCFCQVPCSIATSVLAVNSMALLQHSHFSATTITWIFWLSDDNAPQNEQWSHNDVTEGGLQMVSRM